MILKAVTKFFRIFTIAFVITICVFSSNVKAQSYFPANTISANLITPPSKSDSKKLQDEIATIIKLQKNFDLEKLDEAAFEAKLKIETLLELAQINLNKDSNPHLFHLLERVRDTSIDVTDNIKGYWQQERPFAINPKVKTFIFVKKDFAYPSGHATGSYIYAHILSLLIPQKRDEFYFYANRIAQNRILIGAHYPQDIEGGKELSYLIVGALTQNEEFQEDLQKAKEEMESKR